MVRKVYFIDRKIPTKKVNLERRFFVAIVHKNLVFIITQVFDFVNASMVDKVYIIGQ